MKAKPTDFDGYLATVPDDARTTLEALRRSINTAVPDAVESISYGLPTFKYQGRPLVYFGAWQNHCALYGINVDAHQDELSPYDTVKGTIRFPPDQPLPEALVHMLVSARVAQIEATAGEPKRKKSRAESSV